MKTTPRASVDDATPSRARTMPSSVAWLVAIVGAFVAGLLTSFGQPVPGLSTISNSAGPWFLVTVGLVAVPRPRMWVAVPLGIALLLLMHVGYTVATNLRGYPDYLSITNLWVVLAFPAGALAGWCAVVLRGSGSASARPFWRALAVGVIVAILAGEGIRSLLRIADTTGTVPWVVEICVAVVLLVVALVLARTAIVRIVLLASALVGTAGVLGALLVVGG